MGFFSNLFSGKPVEQNANAQLSRRLPEVQQNVQERRAGNGISYDAELVGKLKEDHAEIFVIYGKLTAAIKNDDYRSVPQSLKDLKLMLQTHLMVENVRFYVYLQQNFGAEADVAGFIKDVRKEMDGIAHAAISFINKYSTATFSPEVKQSFSNELEAIGKVLVKRISMEETRLYTMYQPC